MMLKTLAIAAAGLAAATAFLIPPEIAQADIDIINTLPFEIPKTAETLELDLPCPNCPIERKKKDGRVKVKHGVDSHLQMNFTIDHQAEHDRLLVNGFELYPNSDPMHNVFSAPQIPHCHKNRQGKAEKHGHDEDKKKGRKSRHKKREPLNPRLGFSLQWNPMGVDEQSRMELVFLDLQIMEIGTSFVDTVPDVNIKLIKTAEGGLMIGHIQVADPVPAKSSPMDKQEECTTLICKWKAIITEQLRHAKGRKCGKGAKAGQQDKEGHHRAKGHHQPHHHHHHAHLPLNEHSWSQLFKKLGSHVLFPVLVGIVAGVSVSIVGMVVGTLIVGLWRVFVRRQPFFHQRRRHTGHAHKAAQKEAVVSEEKSGLMEHQDAPPSYEETDKTDDA